MQRATEQRSGSLGLRIQPDGLHGMTPRTLQDFMHIQQPNPQRPAACSITSSTLSRPASTGGSTGHKGVSWAAGNSPQSTSSDKSKLQDKPERLPKLSLRTTSASASAAVGRCVSPGVGVTSPGRSPCNQAKWHVQYKFSTPIEKHLQQQLEIVKRDPAERKALEARIKAYEDAEQPAREAREALLVANKLQAATLTADVKLQSVQQEAKARQERMQQVKQQHQQREHELQSARLAAVQRSERIKQRRLEEEAARERESLQVFQNKHWSGAVAVTACVSSVVSTIRQKLLYQEVTSQQETAVITIQSYWRGYLARRSYMTMVKAVRKLQAAYRQHLSKNTERTSRLKTAAECVLRFLTGYNGQNEMTLAVKQIQFAVLRDVRLSKQLNLLRTAQHILVTNQWTALEARMLTLARKRAGADVISAPAKQPNKQTKSGLASQLESRRKGTAVAAERRKTAEEPFSGLGAGSNSAPAGPSPASCKARDRTVLESLEPTPLRLKGLIAQVYIKMKAEHYIRVIGLCWRDKAVYRRQSKTAANLAAARSILHGITDSQNGGLEQQSSSISPPSNANSVPGSKQSGLETVPLTCPVLQPFRATATLQELGVLMQQAAAEAPYYEAVIARQNLDEYMAKLEQELAARKRQQLDSSMQEQANGREDPVQQENIHDVTSNGGCTSAAKPNFNNEQGVSAREMLQRMEACLSRRFALANCSLLEGLLHLPATCQTDWDDVTLSTLLYRS